MRGPRLLIVSPLPQELSALLPWVRGARPVRLGGVAATVGELEGQSVALASTGPGPVRAQRLHALLSRWRPSHLMAVGVAGALSPELHSTAVVWGRELEETRLPSRRLTSHWPWAPPLPESVVLSHHQWVATPAHKRTLWEEKAGGRPAVVDNESWSYAQAAMAHRVDWLVLRAVFDRHDEPLPEFLLASRDPTGQLSPAKLGVQLLRHPSILKELASLRARMRRCAASLSQAVRHTLRELPPHDRP